MHALTDSYTKSVCANDIQCALAAIIYEFIIYVLKIVQIIVQRRFEHSLPLVQHIRKHIRIYKYIYICRDML